MSLRDQIAAKRAQAQKEAARIEAARANFPSSSSIKSYNQGKDALQENTVEKAVTTAGKKGKLDISSMNLESIPSDVFTGLLMIPEDQLSVPPPKASSSSKNSLEQITKSIAGNLKVSDNAGKEEVFGKGKQKSFYFEPDTELVVFKADHNRISHVNVEIGMFGSLTSIDLSSNQIESLPSSFSDLLRLTSLNLSHNNLISLPNSILLLPKLEVLDLSYNKLDLLDFSNPLEPSDEGLGYGAGLLTTSISRNLKKGPKVILPVLRNLNFGFNKLTTDSLKSLNGIGRMEKLLVLNLESNDLEGTLRYDDLGLGKATMPQLTSLSLKGNGYLQGTTGELASGCKVDMEGTGTFSGSRSTKKVEQSTSSSPDTDSLPIPKPDMTIVYRTCPAASFDGLPLSVDFDLYLPPTAAASNGHPFVIWFHGGGLLQGNKENLPPHFRRLPQTPFNGPSGEESLAVISANYRLSPQVPIIDILSDITALIQYIKTKLNGHLEKDGRGNHKIDTDRICLSGGSAGGYLALIAGMNLNDKRLKDEDVGGYRGEKGIKCMAPFYPITDLTDTFWSTETNPVPWMNRSIKHEEAKPHIDPKAEPVQTAISGGPRSILYAYMLQHSLFPSLLFRNQKSIGQGLDAFRPTPESLSITTRMELMNKLNMGHPPVYLIYGDKDDKVQNFDKTVKIMKEGKGEVEMEVREGMDHQFDEDPSETCDKFREWIRRTLL